MNYFIIQELSSFLFLLFSFSFLQFFFFCLKVGVSPFHFWLISLSDGFFGFRMVWFLTFHKFPYFFIFIFFFFSFLFLFIFLGIFFCYLQFFFLKSSKLLVVLFSVESFS